MYLVTRRESFARIFFLLSFFGLVMYLVLAFYTFHAAFTAVAKTEKTQKQMKGYPDPGILPEPANFRIKYILLYTTPYFNQTGIIEGHKTLIKNDCRYLNCFLTTNASLLNNDIRNFDAIVFSIGTLALKRLLPKLRSEKQKYVFYAMSPSNNPLCDSRFDNFFNWTWTYKLYSDIVSPLIEVKDTKKRVVAPRLNVKWIPDMQNDFNDTILTPKPKAVIWHTDNCELNIRSHMYAKELQRALNEHSLGLDIYGCQKKCPDGDCLSVIENNYSFYLSFEESLVEDYVTSDVLKAYHHDAIPIVMGGAEYNKFLPPGSYIDARFETPSRLASLIEYIIRNPNIYTKYFAWKNYYTIAKGNVEKGYCDLCTLLNDKTRVETHSTYEKFRKWWFYGSLKESCFPKGAERYDEVLSYINDTNSRRKYMT